MRTTRVIEEIDKRGRSEFYPQIKRFGIWWPITIIPFSDLKSAINRAKYGPHKEKTKIHITK